MCMYVLDRTKYTYRFALFFIVDNLIILFTTWKINRLISFQLDLKFDVSKISIYFQLIDTRYLLLLTNDIFLRNIFQDIIQIIFKQIRTNILDGIIQKVHNTIYYDRLPKPNNSKNSQQISTIPKLVFFSYSSSYQTQPKYLNPQFLKSSKFIHHRTISFSNQPLKAHTTIFP